MGWVIFINRKIRCRNNDLIFYFVYDKALYIGVFASVEVDGYIGGIVEIGWGYILFINTSRLLLQVKTIHNNDHPLAGDGIDQFIQLVGRNDLFAGSFYRVLLDSRFIDRPDKVILIFVTVYIAGVVNNQLIFWAIKPVAITAHGSTEFISGKVKHLLYPEAIALQRIFHLLRIVNRIS